MNTQTQRRPAGFWRRALSVLIDTIISLIIISAVTYPMQKFLKSLGMKLSNAELLAGLTIAVEIFGMLIGLLYFVLFDSIKGGTPGKLILGMYIYDLKTKEYLTITKALLRYSLKFFSTMLFGIGYLMGAFRSDKRTLHDLIIGSQVIYEEDET